MSGIHQEIAELERKLNTARAALREARSALATVDHMNGVDSGLEVIRNGRPIKNIIDEALQ
jgi:hypothetical protein